MTPGTGSTSPRRLGWVVIAKTFKHTCPYLLVQRYFVAASFSADSEEFIFRPFVFLRGTGAYKMRGSVPLSYTRAREIVLSAFDSIGLPKQDYGLHSLRAGGASGAANAGVPDRLFKRRGRWKSDKAKDGYINGIMFIHCCRFRYHWVFNFPYFPFF